MKPKPDKKIDKLLGDLGLHPHALDPDEVAAGFDSLHPSPTPPPTGPCGKCCFSNEAAACKAGNRIKNRGANTSKVARYRRERMPKGYERTAQEQPASLSLASSFLHPLSCGLRRGRATCAARKAWHLTSGKNVGPGHSTEPRRNAGRNRRNHRQPPPADES
jgi:hypothetical protein